MHCREIPADGVFWPGRGGASAAPAQIARREKKAGMGWSYERDSTRLCGVSKTPVADSKAPALTDSDRYELNSASIKALQDGALYVIHSMRTIQHELHRVWGWARNFDTADP